MDDVEPVTDTPPVEAEIHEAAETSGLAEVNARLSRIEAFLTEDFINAMRVLQEAIDEIDADDRQPQTSHPLYRKLWGNRE